jgi:hypothetical protein
MREDRRAETMPAERLGTKRRDGSEGDDLHHDGRVNEPTAGCDDNAAGFLESGR